VVIRASETDLAVLDLRQERNARALGDGHRIVYGVAGSGKTVLLIARAKLLAEDPEKRILILCYNRLLAQHLAVALAGHRRVMVTASISARARRTAPSVSACLPDLKVTRACAAATTPY
jgi:superfamily I DNA and RNA helicase